jgi:hypothetical protein
VIEVHKQWSEDQLGIRAVQHAIALQHVKCAMYVRRVQGSVCTSATWCTSIASDKPVHLAHTGKGMHTYYSLSAYDEWTAKHKNVKTFEVVECHLLAHPAPSL